MIFQDQILLPDAAVLDSLQTLDLNACEEKWTFWVPVELSRRWAGLSDETRYALYLMGVSVEAEVGGSAPNL